MNGVTTKEPASSMQLSIFEFGDSVLLTSDACARTRCENWDDDWTRGGDYRALEMRIKTRG